MLAQANRVAILLQTVLKAAAEIIAGTTAHGKHTICRIRLAAVAVINNTPSALELGVVVIAADGRGRAAVLAGPATTSLSGASSANKGTEKRTGRKIQQQPDF